jgi:SAM-dependent methyltransferase
MARSEPFDNNSDKYEQWFDRYPFVYKTELAALRELLPLGICGAAGAGSGAEAVGKIGMSRGGSFQEYSLGDRSPDEYSLEIGVGSGLFAGPLGITHGIDPSLPMLELARERGIRVAEGVAEKLPYQNSSFVLTLMVTAICYIDDLDQSLEEIRRVLRPGGKALFGFVDSDSPLGKFYSEHKDESLFYGPATFRSVTEVLEALQRHSFVLEAVRQTVFGKLDEIQSVQPARDGHGTGGFAVIRAGCSSA